LCVFDQFDIVGTDAHVYYFRGRMRNIAVPARRRREQKKKERRVHRNSFSGVIAEYNYLSCGREFVKTFRSMHYNRKKKIKYE